MNLEHDIPLRSEDGDFHVVVETPRHSRVKLKYEPKLGFIWSRPLTLGVAFPYDFGFFPRSTAQDGDPLDALVLTEYSSFPGVIVPSRVIGALRVEQRRPHQRVKRNDRVIVVPVDEKRRADVADVRELPDRVLEELEEFFRASIVLTRKAIKLCGWAGAPEARRIVVSAGRDYERAHA